VLLLLLPLRDFDIHFSRETSHEITFFPFGNLQKSKTNCTLTTQRGCRVSSRFPTRTPKKPKKNTRRSTAQHRRRTGTATPTHPSTSRQSYKAFDSISMFAAVERGTARTPWEFSIPRSSLENEGCTGARRQLQSPAIKSTPSARPRVTRGSALVDVVALVFPRHPG